MERMEEEEIEAVGRCPPVKFTNPDYVNGSLFFARYGRASSGRKQGRSPPLIPPFNFTILSLIYDRD